MSLRPNVVQEGLLPQEASGGLILGMPKKTVSQGEVDRRLRHLQEMVESHPVLVSFFSANPQYLDRWSILTCVDSETPDRATTVVLEDGSILAVDHDRLHLIDVREVTSGISRIGSVYTDERFLQGQRRLLTGPTLAQRGR